MILSVLIPSMYKRAGLLACMLGALERQIAECEAVEDVEILVNIDEGADVSGKTTGRKRNELLSKAVGDYVVFVDDDDEVAGYYIEEILVATRSKPDAIGIQGKISTNGANEKKWFISKDLEYCAKYDAAGKEYYARFNNHLSPVRRDIALQIGYPDQTVGEDYHYAVRLHESGLIKTEVIVDREMYHYKFKNVK